MTIQQLHSSFALIPTARSTNARFASQSDSRRQRKKILKKPLL
jgi:hypothetical protein